MLLHKVTFDHDCQLPNHGNCSNLYPVSNYQNVVTTKHKISLTRTSQGTMCNSGLRTRATGLRQPFSFQPCILKRSSSASAVLSFASISERGEREFSRLMHCTSDVLTGSYFELVRFEVSISKPCVRQNVRGLLCIRTFWFQQEDGIPSHAE